MLSQIKIWSSLALAAIMGGITAQLYFVLGIPHFLYVIYNIVVIAVAALYQQQIDKRKWRTLLFIAIFIQFPLFFIFSYVNYIFTMPIVFLYLGYFIWRRWGVVWPSGVLLGLIGLLFIYQPGAVFDIIVNYNRLVMGEFSVWFN